MSDLAAPYVFISYSRDKRDIPVVDALETLLLSEGFEVFRDTNRAGKKHKLKPGKDLDKQIWEKLLGATVVVGCWSHAAHERDYMRAEVREARERDRDQPLPSGEARYLPIGINGFKAKDLRGPFKNDLILECGDWKGGESGCYASLRDDIDERIQAAREHAAKQAEEQERLLTSVEKRLLNLANRSDQISRIEAATGGQGEGKADGGTWSVFSVRGTGQDLLAALADHLMIRQGRESYMALRESDPRLAPLIVRRPMRPENYQDVLQEALARPADGQSRGEPSGGRPGGEVGEEQGEDPIIEWLERGRPIKVVYTALEFDGDETLLKRYALAIQAMAAKYQPHVTRKDARVIVLLACLVASPDSPSPKPGFANRLTRRLQRWTGVANPGEYKDLGAVGRVSDGHIETWADVVGSVLPEVDPESLKTKLLQRAEFTQPPGIRYRALVPILGEALINHPNGKRSS